MIEAQAEEFWLEIQKIIELNIKTPTNSSLFKIQLNLNGFPFISEDMITDQNFQKIIVVDDLVNVFNFIQQVNNKCVEEKHLTQENIKTKDQIYDVMQAIFKNFSVKEQQLYSMESFELCDKLINSCLINFDSKATDFFSGMFNGFIPEQLSELPELCAYLSQNSIIPQPIDVVNNILDLKINDYKTFRKDVEMIIESVEIRKLPLSINFQNISESSLNQISNNNFICVFNLDLCELIAWAEKSLHTKELIISLIKKISNKIKFFKFNGNAFEKLSSEYALDLVKLMNTLIKVRCISYAIEGNITKDSINFIRNTLFVIMNNWNFTIEHLSINISINNIEWKNEDLLLLSNLRANKKMKTFKIFMRGKESYLKNFAESLINFDVFNYGFVFKRYASSFQENATRISEEGFIVLEGLISQWQNLEQFCIDFSGENQQITSLVFGKVVSQLAKCPKLQIVDIRIAMGSNSIETNGFILLVQNLKNSFHLEQLIIDLSEGNNAISNKALVEFKDASINWKNLKTLTFDLSYGNNFINDIGFSALSDAIAGFRYIETITLFFSGGYNSIKNCGIKNLAIALKNCNKCKKLSLCLNRGLNEIFDSGLAELAKTLKNMAELEMLFLDFCYGKNCITDEGLQYFSNELNQSKSNLKKFLLFIDSGKNKLTDKGIFFLSAMLKTKKLLSHLSLSFSGTEMFISDQGLSQLSGALINFNLTDLFLSFCFGLNSITDYGLNLLINAIEKSKQLKNIILNMKDGNNRISYNGLSTLGMALHNFPQLISLSLSLNNKYIEINYECLKKFGFGLKHLKKLKNFSIDLSLKLLTSNNDAIEDLFKCFAELQLLENLHLLFHLKESIEKEKLKKYIDCLKISNPKLFIYNDSEIQGTNNIKICSALVEKNKQ